MPEGMVTCPECEGTRETPGGWHGTVPCWWCEGTGFVPASDPAVYPGYVPQVIRNATAKVLNKYRPALEELA